MDIHTLLHGLHDPLATQVVPRLIAGHLIEDLLYPT